MISDLPATRWLLRRQAGFRFPTCQPFISLSAGRLVSQRERFRFLKKEKSGLLAIFAIFTAFDLLGSMINKHHEFNQFLLITFISTLLYYIVIKILGKHTTILHEP